MNFWMEAEDSATTVAALTEHDVVVGASIIDELNGRSLVRIDWIDAISMSIDSPSTARVDTFGSLRFALLASRVPSASVDAARLTTRRGRSWAVHSPCAPGGRYARVLAAGSDRDR